MNNKASMKSEMEWIQVTKQIVPTIRKYALEVDQEGKFPLPSINLLREHGLLGIMVPEEYGGAGTSLETILQICRIISGACLSTGMIWAMHVQQAFIVQNYFSDTLKQRFLHRLAAGEIYVVSVTSDKDANNGPMSTNSYLCEIDGGYTFQRQAPTVTGAAYGDAYLIIIRKGEDNPALSFVLAERNQVKLEVKDSWDSMGMRGTQSCEISMECAIPKDQLLHSHDFDTVCNETMNPIAHLVWSACWLGAVEAEYRNFMSVIRAPNFRKKYNIDSDLLLHDIGNIRMKLDLVESYIKQFATYYSEYKSQSNHYSQTYKIKVNNLKLGTSEILCEVMDSLLQLSGVRLGYVRNQDASIEKVYRDIRSSRLMLSNEKLKVINGKMCFLERS
ncbi:Dibenzothiophene desulfurization enzyme C [compost metagenome]